MEGRKGIHPTQEVINFGKSLLVGKGFYEF